MSTATTTIAGASGKDQASEFWVRKYEEDARKNWDVFYKNNADRFFKDRHYLRREFPDVFPRGSAAIDDDDDDDGGGSDDDDDEPGAPSSSNVSQTPNPDEHELGPAPAYVIPDRAAAAGAAPGRVFLEVGCGAGNTTFPLLAADPTAIVYCCDFSQRAVDLVRKRAERLPPEQRARVIPFVCDATRDALTDRVPAGGVDVCTLIFVLSAVSPGRAMSDVVRNVSSVMRGEGEGRVLVRDYAAGDLAQARFAVKEGQRLGDNFYVRGDGTRAYYFTPAALKGIFSEHGMPLERLDVHERSITNRSRELTMDRRWVQASFASATTPGAPLPPPPPPPEPAWMARKRLIAEKAERAKKAEEEDAAAAGEDETSTDAAS